MRGWIPRREFLRGMGVVTAAASVPYEVIRAAEPQPLYPPTDLSYFDKPISAAPADIRLGYAAITWGDNDRQAIEDISSLGFRGIQLRSNAIQEFGSAGALREALSQHRLALVALSSGAARVDPAVEAEEIAKHTEHAKFVHEAGGLYLQVTDQRPKEQQVTASDYKRLGHVLTEIGKRTADLGVSLGYHNHMGTLGERPEEVEQILDAVDPRYVKLELDVAHYFQGGGDPVMAIEKYRDRLLFLHIKDVEKLAASEISSGKHPYRFVELGHGQVNLRAVFGALERVQFRGWAIVELDRVPDASRTPKECAAISKKYLEQTLGVKA